MNDEDMKGYKQHYYQVHKSHLNALSKQRAAERRIEIQQWFEEAKQGKSCQGCGITDPRLLEFRYINEKTGKEANLKNIAISSKWGEERIRLELKKAKLLCWNCRHADSQRAPE